MFIHFVMRKNKEMTYEGKHSVGSTDVKALQGLGMLDVSVEL